MTQPDEDLRVALARIEAKLGEDFHKLDATEIAQIREVLTHAPDIIDMMSEVPLDL